MKKNNIKIHIIIGLIIVLIDQVTKWITVSNLKEFQSVTVIENFFNFTFVKNTGAAWGIFNKSTLLLTIFSIFILVLFMYMYYVYQDKITRFLLAIIISGAIGNLIDRIRLQYVVDFFDFNLFGYRFPVFNVADIAVSVATLCLIVYLLFQGDRK